MPKTSNLKTSLLLVFPQKPVYGDLGAQDGEEECEDAVLEFVAVGGVYDEGAGNGQGRDDEEEGDAEDGDAQGPADGALAAGFVSRQFRAAGHGAQSFVSEELEDAAGFSEDLSGDFFSLVSVLESPLEDAAAGSLGPFLLL